MSASAAPCPARVPLARRASRASASPTRAFARRRVDRAIRPIILQPSGRNPATGASTDAQSPSTHDGDEDPPPARVATPADFFDVRAATDTDAADVIACARAAGVEWSDAQIAEEIHKGNFVLATRKGRGGTSEPPSPLVVGVCCAWVVAGEVQILEVATHPSARREGVGGLVVRAACDRCTGGDAFLEVRASNAAALGLYAKLGFKEEGRRRGFYNDGEDAVLMRLTPRAVSARELTRLMAGLTREEARRPAPKTREEKQRGETMHPQDYPRDRPAFRRDGGGGAGGGGGGGGVGGVGGGGGGFKMRNRIRGRGG